MDKIHAVYNSRFNYLNEIKNLAGKGAAVMIGRSIWQSAKKELSSINDQKNKDEMVKEFINFYGNNILVQSKLIAECSEDRLTCQHVRVKQTLLADFLSAVYQVTNSEILELMNDSECFDNNNLKLRVKSE